MAGGSSLVPQEGLAPVDRTERFSRETPHYIKLLQLQTAMA